MPVKSTIIEKGLTLFIALVWLINGLFCKVLNYVPRHQLIVSEILGQQHAFLIIKTIGILEIGMVIWIYSKIKHRLCAITQIVVVLTMNVIETIIVPDLLLFGRGNLLLASMFAGLIYVKEFHMNSAGAKEQKALQI